MGKDGRICRGHPSIPIARGVELEFAMRNYWTARREDADHKRRTAQNPEMRRIYEALVEHYRALEGQCKPSADGRRAGNDRAGPARIAA